MIEKTLTLGKGEGGVRCDMKEGSKDSILK